MIDEIMKINIGIKLLIMCYCKNNLALTKHSPYKILLGFLLRYYSHRVDVDLFLNNQLNCRFKHTCGFIFPSVNVFSKFFSKVIIIPFFVAIPSYCFHVIFMEFDM